MSQTQRQQQTQTGTSTTNQTYTPASNTPDINRLRDEQFQMDPTITSRIGGSIRRLYDSYQSPLGGATTPQIRDATIRSQERELMQMGGEQAREGQHDVNQANYSRNALLAGLTQPTSSAGTSSQQGTITGTMSPGALGSVIGSVAGVGAAAL